MLLSELSNFIRNHLHLKVPMEVGVSDIPKCINDVTKYFVLKSMNRISVALFRASPLLYAVVPHRLQYLLVQHQIIVYRQGRSSSHELISCILAQVLRVCVLDMCLPAQFSIQRHAKIFRCA